jgi:hypothetical protein
MRRGKFVLANDAMQAGVVEERGKRFGWEKMGQAHLFII